MKKIFFISFFCFTTVFCFGQGKSISFRPKVSTPYILDKKDTFKVGDILALKTGSGQNGNFLYVQLLSGLNEPIGSAKSNSAGKKQPILYFKEQDGVTYAFTNFFSVNIDAAIAGNEIKLIKK